VGDRLGKPEPANWIVATTLVIATLMFLITLSASDLDGARSPMSVSIILALWAMPWVAPIALIYREQRIAAVALMVYGVMMFALGIIGFVWFLLPVGLGLLVLGGVVLLESPLRDA
jgi:hypothetical protein